MHKITVICLLLQESCQNYIRVLVSLGPGRLLVCGTNSFRPFCREYSVQRDSYHMEREKSGQAVCPYDPEHNSTAVYAGKIFVFYNTVSFKFALK